jgi:hypothetical protein
MKQKKAFFKSKSMVFHIYQKEILINRQNDPTLFYLVHITMVFNWKTIEKY